MDKIQIDGEHLTLAELYAAVFDGAQVELAAGAREKMNASRAVIERLVESNAAVYGVNTGFGKMASVRISRGQIRQLQVIWFAAMHAQWVRRSRKKRRGR